MGLDFEVQDYIKTLNKNSPPFRCPKCDKKYKSVIGLQYHLNNYDHDNPSPSTVAPVPVVAKQAAAVAGPSAEEEKTPTAPEKPEIEQTPAPIEDDAKVEDVEMKEPSAKDDSEKPAPSTKAPGKGAVAKETPIRPPNNSKQRSQKKKMAVTPKNKNQTAPARESLTYIEQEALIKIEFGGKNINLSVDEEFELITLDEQKKKWDNPDVELFAVPAPTEPEVKLPEGE